MENKNLSSGKRWLTGELQLYRTVVKPADTHNVYIHTSSVPKHIMHSYDMHETVEMSAETGIELHCTTRRSL